MPQHRPRPSAIARAALGAFLIAITAASTACSGDDGDPNPATSATVATTATTTAAQPGTPTPRPVFLQPMDGAVLETGNEQGADFAIEVPDDWNGDLVLFLHGAQTAEPPTVSPPLSREYLVERGYAWGASAFREAGFVPAIAVADTNALYERFVRDHGEPRNVYLYGASMGAAAAIIASEQEAAPYDGVLAVCASAGEQAWLALHADYLTIAAHAAGVVPRDVTPDAVAGIVTEVEAALLTDAARNLFTSNIVGWTGGARPYANEALVNLDDRWAAVRALGAEGALDNIGRDYTSIAIDAGSTITLRRTVAPPGPGSDVTGHLRVPVLTLHETGDAVVPLTDAIAIRQRAEAAGQGGKLVQRTVQSPGHCEFTDDELERAFDDLVAWTEDGIRPDGEDLLSFDPATLGAAFTTRQR